MSTLVVDVGKIEEVREDVDNVENLTATPTLRTPEGKDELSAAHRKAKALIEAISKEGKVPLKPGQDYYVVSKSWMIDVANALVEIETGRDKRLSTKRMNKINFLLPVDNTYLVDRYLTWGLQLRPRIKEIEDYMLVTSKLWESLMDHFGGGPEISRQCHSVNSRNVVDVTGIVLYIVRSEDPSRYYVSNFPKTSSIYEVKKTLCGRFHLHEKDTKLWDFREGRLTAPLTDLEATIWDFKLRQRQFVLLESRLENGSWEIDESTVEIPPLEHRDSRARTISSSTTLDELEGNAEPGLVGLYNLRNTCYMNSTLQSLSNIPQLRDYFTSNRYVKEINTKNPLGSKGKLAEGFGSLMKQMWSQDSPKAMSPHEFKVVLDNVKSDFEGHMQHDAQEFLSVLLDGLHEDVCRVKNKKPTEPVEAKGRPDAVVAAEALETYKIRNDSQIADLFTGMLLSKVVCPRETCDNVSVTFDPYMMLPLPVENGPAKTQEIEVTIIPFEAALRRKYITVVVPAAGPVIHLRSAISSATGIPDSDFFLGELSQNKIIRMINETSNINGISYDTHIYAFENPKALNHLSVLHGDFTQWCRPPLSVTGNKIIVDENLLNMDPAAVRSDAEKNLLGLEFIRLQETPDLQCEISLLPPTNESHNSSSEKLVAPVKHKYDCPFEVGQLWVGNFQQSQPHHMQFSIRIEVTHVIPSDDAFQIMMLIDLNKLMPGSRDRCEQEVRLLVGEYTPTEVIKLRPRRKRGVLGANNRKDEAAGSASKPGKGDVRKSANRSAIPKALSAAGKMFKMSKRKPAKSKVKETGSLRKRSSKAGKVNAAALEEPESPNGSPTEPLSPNDLSLEENSDAQGGSDDTSETSNDTDESSNSFVEQSVGKVDLDACSWRGVYSNVEGITSYIKKNSTFRCSGSVDMSKMVFHGKAIWGGGFQSIGAMDFYARLIPESQKKHHEDPAGAPKAAIDRKLAIFPERAIRYVNKVNWPASRSKSSGRVSRSEESDEFSMDPGVILINKKDTEGDVYGKVVSLFVKIYNDGIKQVDPSVRKKENLPSKLSDEEMTTYLTMRRAAKNYVTDESSSQMNKSIIEPTSSDLFFVNKHSFLRLVIFWDYTCPVVKLYKHFERAAPARRGPTNKMQIYDCLDLFCREEKLSEMDSWYCSTCKQHQEATKTLKIWSFPAVLVLNFKRFSQETEQYTRKVEHLVEFPLEGLDLRKYAQDKKSKQEAIYDLCAVSSHYGGLGSGHYIAFSRNETDGKWYEFDDETVKEVDDHRLICDQAAYVLFYLRRDLRPKTWGNPAPLAA